jgi:hypothetical protein
LLETAEIGEKVKIRVCVAAHEMDKGEKEVRLLHQFEKEFAPLCCRWWFAIYVNS